MFKKALHRSLLVATFAAVLALPGDASAVDTCWSGTTLSLANENLANGAAQTAAIDLGSSRAREVEFNLHFTAGTTTSADFTCEEAATNSAAEWTWITHTTDSSPGIVTKATARMDLTAMTKQAVTVKAKLRYLRCTIEDLADGTGSVANTTGTKACITNLED